MLDRITTLGDRLLTRLVPRTTAAAADIYCWNQSCGDHGLCLVQECCDIPAQGTVCKSCEWIC